jgi:hypothetical protein
VIRPREMPSRVDASLVAENRLVQSQCRRPPFPAVTSGLRTIRPEFDPFRNRSVLEIRIAVSCSECDVETTSQCALSPTS